MFLYKILVTGSEACKIKLLCSITGNTRMVYKVLFMYSRQKCTARSAVCNGIIDRFIS